MTYATPKVGSVRYLQNAKRVADAMRCEEQRAAKQRKVKLYTGPWPPVIERVAGHTRFKD